MATISWIIPSLIEGSGGHRTILSHAYALESEGHSCPIYIEGDGSERSARDAIEKMFGLRFKRASYGWSKVAASDLIMATVWYSAKFVRDLQFDCRKGYFIQDYEAFFNPMGDAFLMAESSYTYGLKHVTIGRWLKRELATRFQEPAFYIDFGADLRIYKKLVHQEPEQSICFIYQPDKPRRCSRLGIEALGIVKHYAPQTKIYLYGSRPSDSDQVWFDHTHLGLLDLQSCNRLYNKCSVGLCISSSNPSRIPFEMMAAGLPVVEVWRDNNLYDMPPEAVCLAGQTPEDIAEGLLVLLNDRSRRTRMSKAGVEFMSTRPIESETEQFKRIVEGILADQKPEIESIRPLYDQPPVKAGTQVHSDSEIVKHWQPQGTLTISQKLKKSFLGWRKLTFKK